MAQYLFHLKQNDPKTMRQARERIRGGNIPYQRRKQTIPEEKITITHKPRQEKDHTRGGNYHTRGQSYHEKFKK
eukprot:14674835-Ditylum_brightwellii.AAC.1